MTPNIQAMQLGDIFDRTFTLFGRTFTRNARLVAVLFIPSLLLVFLAGAMFAAVVASGIDTKDIPALLGISLFFFIALACMIVSVVAGEIAVTRIVCGEMFGQHFSWREGLEAARSIWLGRALGAMILRGIGVSGCIVAGGVIIAVAISVHVAAAMLIGVVLTVACVVFAIRFALLWYLTTPSIVCEDRGVIESMMRSRDLVRGNWWRVFGILLLMGLLTSFAISIITLPIGFATMFGSLRHLFELQAAAGASGAPPNLSPADLKGIFLGYALIILIQSFLNLLLSPLYTAVIYFDLRARHGDFLPAPGITPFIEKYQQATTGVSGGTTGSAADDVAGFQPPQAGENVDDSRFQPPGLTGEARFMPPPDPGTSAEPPKDPPTPEPPREPPAV